jgi:F0F1-type ATP synthase alpha subunit
VYVSLGETDEGELQRKVDNLELCDGMEHTLVIHASAHEPALHRYLAPFIAATIVDHWRQQVLVNMETSRFPLFTLARFTCGFRDLGE